MSDSARRRALKSRGRQIRLDAPELSLFATPRLLSRLCDPPPLRILPGSAVRSFQLKRTPGNDPIDLFLVPRHSLSHNPVYQSALRWPKKEGRSRPRPLSFNSHRPRPSYTSHNATASSSPVAVYNWPVRRHSPGLAASGRHAACLSLSGPATHPRRLGNDSHRRRATSTSNATPTAERYRVRL